MKIVEKRDEKYFFKKPRNWGDPRIMGARKMGGVLYQILPQKTRIIEVRV